MKKSITIEWDNEDIKVSSSHEDITGGELIAAGAALSMWVTECMEKNGDRCSLSEYLGYLLQVARRVQKRDEMGEEDIDEDIMEQD